MFIFDFVEMDEGAFMLAKGTWFKDRDCTRLILRCV